MKNPKPITFCIILLAITIVAVCYFSGWTDSSQEKTSTTDVPHARGKSATHENINSSQPRSSRRAKTENHRAERLRRELKNADDQLNKEMLSSTVNVEIAAGETLVTGGYKRADGYHELTFMTPTTVTLEDGSEAVRLTPRILAVDPEFAKANGLDTLATNARNTLQHAEAWNQKELTAILHAAGQHDGVGIMAAPTILSNSSEPSTISFEEPGKTRYSIVSSIEKTATGGFAIKARVQRTPLQSTND